MIINNKKYDHDGDISIMQVLDDIGYDNPKNYVGVIINNRVYNMHHRVHKASEIQLLSSDDDDGFKIMTRTMTLITALALKRIEPNATLLTEYFIGEGLYFEFDGLQVTHDALGRLKLEMRKIIEQDLPIKRTKMTKKDAICMFYEENYLQKARLFEDLELEEIDVYEVDGHIFTFHGYLAPTTGYGSDFNITLYYPGMVLLFPTPKTNHEIPKFIEQKTLSKLFTDSKKWTELLKIGYAADLNRTIINNEHAYLIDVSEAYFENRIAKIAEEIAANDEVKIILIAGPSSSGKTTTAHRLSVQLGVHGKKPILLSTDNYFVNREDTPLDEDGRYDYEHIQAIDTDRFNRDLIALLDGKKVFLPTFDFIEGKRVESDEGIVLDSEHPCIIEGIHALNPKLTADVPNRNKYLIYISALMQLNIDEHNRISTSDVRLLRRLVRDVKSRGIEPEKTFSQWKSVCRGEERWIFPFQFMADSHIDAALIYEISVLRKHAEILLMAFDENSPHYKDAVRLLSFLKYFRSIEDEAVPDQSILREFIGEKR